MIVLLSFLALFLVLDIAALVGWAPCTRDSRDWTTPDGEGPRRGLLRAH